ncbi:polyubiquitin-like [Euphorbia lathyris]|uniref:polyubiquitin-like n=1 Tax=Euphorbia lathyris TaxID=212925 RepID=UPI00331340FF
MEESTTHNSQLDQQMNVYLKVVKTVPMKIKGSDTIATLKANINQKEGISEMNQKLFFDGKLLPDAQSIVGCGIQNYATLHLISMESAAMKICIKIQPDNRILILETKACESVHNVKLMIQEKEGILPNSFTLVLNGNLLEEKSILASIGIRNNSTIHLIFVKKEIQTLFVKALGMEAVKLCVKVMFTVGDVKAIAMSMIGETFNNNMSLYKDGQVLDDSKTLAFYGIEEGSRLDLLYTVLQIFVKTWSGKTLTLNVKQHHTVKEIIAKTFRKLHNPMPDNVNISLVYAGKRLQNDKDVASYSIQRDSTLLLVLTASCYQEDKTK